MKRKVTTTPIGLLDWFWSDVFWYVTKLPVPAYNRLVGVGETTDEAYKDLESQIKQGDKPDE